MTKTEQFEIASNWFKCLEQRDLEQLVSLYSDTWLSFHPTLWDEHIHNRTRARDYFVSFLSKQPRVHSFDGDLLRLGDHSFLYAGTMTLGLKTESEDRETQISARFSFIWQLENHNQWHIIHHHNSIVPTK